MKECLKIWQYVIAAVGAAMLLFHIWSSGFSSGYNQAMNDLREPIQAQRAYEVDY
jgi:cell shape-determining protein MreC